MPLIEYYIESGKLVETDGGKAIEEVGEDLIAVIGVRIGR
jgi:adenylate kinase family enzyme